VAIHSNHVLKSTAPQLDFLSLVSDAFGYGDKLTLSFLFCHLKKLWYLRRCAGHNYEKVDRQPPWFIIPLLRTSSRDGQVWTEYSDFISESVSYPLFSKTTFSLFASGGSPPYFYSPSLRPAPLVKRTLHSEVFVGLYPPVLLSERRPPPQVGH